jgi:hypothetical protein
MIYDFPRYIVTLLIIKISNSWCKWIHSKPSMVNNEEFIWRNFVKYWKIRLFEFNWILVVMSFIGISSLWDRRSINSDGKFLRPKDLPNRSDRNLRFLWAIEEEYSVAVGATLNPWPDLYAVLLQTLLLTQKTKVIFQI